MQWTYQCQPVMSSKEENGDVEIECEVKENIEEQPSRCDRCNESCIKCLKPILHEYHPLPNNPDRLQRFQNSLYCPPHGRIGAFLFVVVIGAVWWAVLWSITGTQALPGGNLFSLFLLFFFCWCGGYLIQLIRLPPLLGEFIMGLVPRTQQREVQVFRHVLEFQHRANQLLDSFWYGDTLFEYFWLCSKFCCMISHFDFPVRVWISDEKTRRSEGNTL